MIPVRARVELDGRISIGEVLKMAKMQPGDWVDITPASNKITIKIARRIKPKGVVRAAAGVLKDRIDLVNEMLWAREEDDRPGTTM